MAAVLLQFKLFRLNYSDLLLAAIKLDGFCKSIAK